MKQTAQGFREDMNLASLAPEPMLWNLSFKMKQNDVK